MLILVGLFLLVCLGMAMHVFSRWDSLLEFVGNIMSIFSGITLVICLILIPIHRYEVSAGIQEFKSVEQTIEVARQNPDMKLESIAFQQKVAEKNEWLASKKYWNSTVIFDIWIPDEVEKMEPIK